MSLKRVREMVNHIMEGDLEAANDLLTAEMDERKEKAIKEAKAAVVSTIEIQ